MLQTSLCFLRFFRNLGAENWFYKILWTLQYSVSDLPYWFVISVYKMDSITFCEHIHEICLSSDSFNATKDNETQIIEKKH